MRKAISLLKLISQGEKDIKQGNTKTQEQVFKNIDKMLAKKEKANKRDVPYQSLMKMWLSEHLPHSV